MLNYLGIIIGIASLTIPETKSLYLIGLKNRP